MMLSAGEGVLLLAYGIFVDQHVLVDVFPVVGYPHEVGSRLAQLVAGREVGRASEDGRYGVGEAVLFVEQRVAYHPVALGLLEEGDYQFGVLVHEGHGLILGVGAELHHALGRSPHILVEEDAGAVELGVHLGQQDVAVNLEQVGEAREGHVAEVEQRLPLRQVGDLVGEHGPHLVAEGAFPEVLVDDHHHLSRLSAHVGKQGLGALASRGAQGQQHRRQRHDQI